MNFHFNDSFLRGIVVDQDNIQRVRINSGLKKTELLQNFLFQLLLQGDRLNATAEIPESVTQNGGNDLRAVMLFFSGRTEPRLHDA